MNTPPEGFNVGNMDRVAFIRLPEQIQRHYPDVQVFGGVWLSETQAVIQFYPGGDRDDMKTDYWEKDPNGRWILVDERVTPLAAT